MAQNKTIILQRRTAVSGSKPTTGNLQVGEIGLNTYDGTVFIHKSGSTDSIEQLVVTNSETMGSITLSGTGSFGELNILNDANISGDLYVTNDIVANGNIDILGAISASIISASHLIGDGSGITGITASMRPDDFDFNSDPFAGTIGYIQGSGSAYKVATVTDSIDFRYNDVTIATITTANGFSGSLYGIGDVLAFSGSIAQQFADLQASASVLDAGTF